MSQAMETEKRSAFFAGSFNPFTVGHLDILERGVALFGHVTVALGVNERKPESESEERFRELEKLFAGRGDVDVVRYTGLTAQAALGHGACCLLRGVRGVADFEYERNMAEVNRQLFGIDTVLLFADPRLSSVSSSVVRELEHFGYDTSRFVIKP